jgi:hypothetical protein
MQITCNTPCPPLQKIGKCVFHIAITWSTPCPHLQQAWEVCLSCCVTFQRLLCSNHPECVGLARTIHIQCTYGICGREITKYTVIYGVYIQFWPTLRMCPPYRFEFSWYNDSSSPESSKVPAHVPVPMQGCHSLGKGCTWVWEPR